MSADLYADLQIGKGASPDEVKTAYRKLARQLHPDKNAAELHTDAELFKRVNHAYSILSDPERRTSYDRSIASVARIERSAHVRQNCDLLLFESSRLGLVPDIVKAVKAGAHVQWRNPGSDGRTALHVAARGGHAEAVQLLVSLGADHRAANHFRETPLHEAAASGQHATALQLIGYGADANSLNKYNASALHCASAEGHTLAALVLLCCGVDAGIVTVYGMTGARCFADSHELVWFPAIDTLSVHPPAADLAAQRNHERLRTCLDHAVILSYYVYHMI
jgi:DnaJ-domain-containing protein 1